MRSHAASLAFIAAAVLAAPAASALTPTTLQIDSIDGEFWVLDSSGLLGWSSGGDLVSATLKADDAPVVGRALTFTTADGRVICTATTNTWGVASCPHTSIVFASPVDEFTARFDGDEEFAAAEAAGNLGTVRLSVRGRLECWAVDSNRGLLGCHVK